LALCRDPALGANSALSRTWALDRIHHPSLIGQENIAEALGPFEIAVHHAQDLLEKSRAEFCTRLAKTALLI
jgi:hypothetical protein